MKKTQDKPGSSTATCPRCQQPNQCAMANNTDAARCWCMQAPVVTDIIPKTQSCLCPACLEEFTPDA